MRNKENTSFYMKLEKRSIDDQKKRETEKKKNFLSLLVGGSSDILS